VEVFAQPHLEEVFKGLMAELNLSPGELIHPARTALTGRKVSPGIYDVVELLGRETVVRRLRAGAARAEALGE
ncbi:MAG TPA: glutamate--tRNA ligase, partial [Firmicutes bacterium]|nr:glutamate--tRNA ligase [Bacillota bacterium]